MGVGLVCILPDGNASHDDLLDGQGKGAGGQGYHHHRASGTYHLREE